MAPARSGQTGDNVAALQERLLALGFWLDGIDHRYGFVTSQAVMAFQKHFGLKADGIAGKATVALLSQPLPRVSGKATSGDLVEVDKAKQVLYIVRGGQTIWAFNTSTGSGKDYTEFSEKDQRPISGSAITPEGKLQGEPRAHGRLVGRRARRLVPAQVLPGRRGRAREQQDPELPRLPRLRTGQHEGHGLHLGPEPHAAALEGLGARRLTRGPRSAATPASTVATRERSKRWCSTWAASSSRR